jgi:6-phosphofructokinase 1
MKIAVNTGGGDAPGLNAAIHAISVSAHGRGWEVWGIRHGYRGLIEDDPSGVVKLDRDAVRGIQHLGGTILGSTNRGDPFRYGVTTAGGELEVQDVSNRLVQRFHEHGFDALVALGGDGSIAIAKRLLDLGIPRVVAVPKTIDNDLAGTDVTFGFDTAVATATDAIDRLHSTAQAHERVMVVEVMGRYAGWIALYSGVAGGADVVLIPELEFDLERVCEKVLQRERLGRTFSIVVAAEGARARGGERVFQGVADQLREHKRLGGIAELLAREIEERTGKEARSLVLGHLQRGGSPVMSDRLLAARVGCAATRFLATTEASGLVAVRDGELRLVPLEECIGRIRTVPLDSNMLQTGRDLGLCFGDEPPGTFGPAA